MGGTKANDWLYGFRCPDCGRAMFFLEREPKPGAPITLNSCIVRKEAPRPGTDGRIECQWCGSRWINLRMESRFFGRFTVCDGEEVPHVGIERSPA